MPPRCAIAIVHEQGTEARSEMNTREQRAEVRSEMNTPPPPVRLSDAELNKTAHKALFGSMERIP